MDERHFRGNYGVSEGSFNLIVELLEWYDVTIKAKHVLWALYFLHNYPTQDIMETIFKTNKETLTSWIWKVIIIFTEVIIPKFKIIDIDKRTFLKYSTLSLVIDGTECPINRPSNNETQRLYYSGKKKQHTIKYIVGCDINTGKILFVDGSYPGSYHDMKIATLSQITDKLPSNEYILADKAYIGDQNIIVPFKRNDIVMDEQVFINSFINQVRVIIENVYGRMKAWKCLVMDWRHDLDIHNYAFKFICGAINLDFKYHPIRST